MKQSWKYTTWDAVEMANLEEAAKMTFTQKVEWLEATSQLVRELKQSKKTSTSMMCVEESNG